MNMETNQVHTPDPNFWIFLCFGQSNMAGQAPIEEQDLAVSERFLSMATTDGADRKLGTWRKAVPPLCHANPTINDIASRYPNTYVVSSEGCLPCDDNLHFCGEGYRLLGRHYAQRYLEATNNFEIPQIGVGTWTLRGETARQNVRLALEAGFRHIDTAQGYENEAEVGQGVIDSGIPRQEIFLTTKVATNIMREGREAVRKSIDESLTKLKTNYIDLLLIHWPVKDCVKDTWQVMEEYVRQGKVKSIGVSNFNRHHLDDLLSYAEIRPVINQIEVHPFTFRTVRRL